MTQATQQLAAPLGPPRGGGAAPAPSARSAITVHELPSSLEQCCTHRRKGGGGADGRHTDKTLCAALGTRIISLPPAVTVQGGAHAHGPAPAVCWPHALCDDWATTTGTRPPPTLMDPTVIPHFPFLRRYN